MTKIKPPFKCLGVLGGMGPAATYYFCNLLLRMTPAKKDQDHIPTLVYSNTTIPDRTSQILAKNTKPLQDKLVESVACLEAGGAQFFVSPCNTVHYFSDTLTQSARIPFINMIEVTSTFIHHYYPGKKIGILGTAGTLKSRLYQTPLEEKGIDVILPLEHNITPLMSIITAIKAGRRCESTQQLLLAQVHQLLEQGADKVIAGCTELPLLGLVREDLIDPMEVLANCCLQFAAS